MYHIILIVLDGLAPICMYYIKFHLIKVDPQIYGTWSVKNSK